MNERIGKFIAESRNQAGLTQKELAEKIGVSDKTISKWECGKSVPDISYLDALCNSLSINMNELISGQRLTETDYSVKAEENIMALMKENKNIRKGTLAKNVFGVLLAVLTLILAIANTSYGGANSIIFYMDLPTLSSIAFLSVAGVLLSGKKSYVEILEVLQKISIPNGVLITFILIVMVLAQSKDVSHLMVDIAVCTLSCIYAIIEYLIVFVLRQHAARQ